MTKSADEIKPNYGPVYAAALYPELCRLFQKHGYALAVHGSLARDLDLIAIPWIDNPSPIGDVLAEALKMFAIEEIGDPTVRAAGRIAYSFSVGFGYCQIDLSVFDPCQNRKGD